MSARRSLAQFQSFLLGLLELGRRLVGGEMSFHVFYLDILLIQSVYPNDQRKSVYRPSWLSVIRVSAYQYNFRNENNVSVLINPVRNHLTVGTRARLTTLGNIGFSIQMSRRKTCTVIHDSVSSGSRLINITFVMKMVICSLDTPSKKSSHCWNACKADYAW